MNLTNLLKISCMLYVISLYSCIKAGEPSSGTFARGAPLVGIGIGVTSAGISIIDYAMECSSPCRKYSIIGATVSVMGIVDFYVGKKLWALDKEFQAAQASTKRTVSPNNQEIKNDHD